MATRYQLYKDRSDGVSIKAVKRILDDGTITCIPMVVGNRDYDKYLEWAKSNTIEAADALTWDDIRAKRDTILQSTDWTMIPGASVDQTAWGTYRQNIRDIPQTYKDKTPDDVVWPTQPSTAGPNS